MATLNPPAASSAPDQTHVPSHSDLNGTPRPAPRSRHDRSPGCLLKQAAGPRWRPRWGRPGGAWHPLGSSGDSLSRLATTPLATASRNPHYRLLSRHAKSSNHAQDQQTPSPTSPRVRDHKLVETQNNVMAGPSKTESFAFGVRDPRRDTLTFKGPPTPASRVARRPAAAAQIQPKPTKTHTPQDRAGHS